jgi:hypothetical protein
MGGLSPHGRSESTSCPEVPLTSFQAGAPDPSANGSGSMGEQVPFPRLAPRVPIPGARYPPSPGAPFQPSKIRSITFTYHPAPSTPVVPLCHPSQTIRTRWRPRPKSPQLRSSLFLAPNRPQETSRESPRFAGVVAVKGQPAGRARDTTQGHSRGAANPQEERAAESSSPRVRARLKLAFHFGKQLRDWRGAL